MQQGLAAVLGAGQTTRYVLFVDADISLSPALLGRLVALAETRRAVLVSLMVKLRCESFAERWLVPAFVFFFQLLYPFPWVNDPRRRTAAAAGGCMLVDCDALAAAGGFEGLKGALIDDCALGALMKRRGPIWLGLTPDACSRRAYPRFSDFGRMVARSAFAELRFSVLRLAAAVAGMTLVFVAPPFITLFTQDWARAAGALAWALMALAFAPTLRLYGRPLVSAFALPAVAVAYVISATANATRRNRIVPGRSPLRGAAPGQVYALRRAAAASTRRFNRRISGVNWRSGVVRNSASIPPLCSIVRIAAALIRQPDRAEHVRQHRDLLQVWQKAPLCLVVGVADVVADLNALAG